MAGGRNRRGIGYRVTTLRPVTARIYRIHQRRKIHQDSHEEKYEKENRGHCNGPSKVKTARTLSLCRVGRIDSGLPEEGYRKIPKRHLLVVCEQNAAPFLILYML